ncbi:MAG: nucleotidyltransferase domain-containing protein [Ignavibacteriales bacterium]|nr:nucleotidyltransferase domain-containing protein [Ignavibacteriales bacterium]
MTQKLDLSAYSAEIQAFCKKNDIVELSVFGSILTEDFSPESDIDFLVTFNDSSVHNLFHVARMKEELQNIIGWEVDFVNKKSITKSQNYFRKKSILSNNRVIYAA